MWSDFACTTEECEAILGLMKLNRIFISRTFQQQGYKCKSEFQLNVLNDILKLVPYPNSEMRETLGIILDICPRSIQIWFQNTRQSLTTTLKYSFYNLKSASLSTKDIFNIVIKRINNIVTKNVR